MSRGRGNHRAYALLELVFTVALVALILLVLGKLVVDGIYLQRVAAQYVNRGAVTAALTERLRADALGAVTYTWREDTAGQTLALSTYAGGSHRHVRWMFRRDEVLRTVEGRDAGGFSAERLRFSARLDHGAQADMLALEFVVPPPVRAHRRSPRVFSEYVLLPRETLGPANTAEEPPQ